MPSVDTGSPGETASSAVPQDARVYWVYTDYDHGDTLDGVLERKNLDGITVVSKIDYEGGSLWQIRVEH